MKNNTLTLTLNLENLSEEEYIKLLELAEKANKPTPKAKVWRPEKDEKYYTIAICGDVRSYLWDGESYDKDIYDLGLCYPTKEAAEFATERQRVYTALQRYAEEHNTEEIDWKNNDQNKYYIWYYHPDACINIGILKIHQDIGTIYFTSEELAKAAIEEIGEDIIKKYLFGIEV